MGKICPLCNLLQSIQYACPICGSMLLDGGKIENYLDSYGPYFESVTNINDDDGRCIHLLYCPHCRYDEQRAVDTVEL